MHATIVGVIMNEEEEIVYESNRNEGVLFPGDILLPGDILGTLQKGSYTINFKVILNPNTYEGIELKRRSKRVLKFKAK